MNPREDAVTSNFLQYQTDSAKKRDCHSFVMPQKDQFNMINDDQEFKAPKDICIQTNDYVKDSNKGPGFIVDN